METYLCPKGHRSTEPDYCSECGARIDAEQASLQNGSGAAAPTSAPEVCPDCGTVRDQPGIAFCEICGYNFNTGAHGDVSLVPAPPASVAIPLPPPDPLAGSSPQADPEQPLQWIATVTVDPTLHGPGSPEPPAGVGPYTFPLAPVNLIGRRSEARGIFPEIPLSYDDAVSHRHALLQVDDAGRLSLRDIGAANGTQLNGGEMVPMQDYPLSDGDEISLGHWSRIRVNTVNG